MKFFQPASWAPLCLPCCSSPAPPALCQTKRLRKNSKCWKNSMFQKNSMFWKNSMFQISSQLAGLKKNFFFSWASWASAGKKFDNLGKKKFSCAEPAGPAGLAEQKKRQVLFLKFSSQLAGRHCACPAAAAQRHQHCAGKKIEKNCWASWASRQWFFQVLEIFKVLVFFKVTGISVRNGEGGGRSLMREFMPIYYEGPKQWILLKKRWLTH